jgi:hypothetical protein
MLDPVTHRGAATARLDGAGSELTPCGEIAGPELFFSVHVTERTVLSASTSLAFRPDWLEHGCGTAPDACGPLCDQSTGDFIDVMVAEAGTDAIVALRALDQATATGAATIEIAATAVGDVGQVVPLVDPPAVQNGTAYGGTITLPAATSGMQCGVGSGTAVYFVVCSGNIAFDSLTVCPEVAAAPAATLEMRTTPGGCVMPDASGCASTLGADTSRSAVVAVVRSSDGAGGRVRVTTVGH